MKSDDQQIEIFQFDRVGGVGETTRSVCQATNVVYRIGKVCVMSRKEFDEMKKVFKRLETRD